MMAPVVEYANAGSIGGKNISIRRSMQTMKGISPLSAGPQRELAGNFDTPFRIQSKKRSRVNNEDQHPAFMESKMVASMNAYEHRQRQHANEQQRLLRIIHHLQQGADSDSENVKPANQSHHTVIPETEKTWSFSMKRRRFKHEADEEKSEPIGAEQHQMISSATKLSAFSRDNKRIPQQHDSHIQDQPCQHTKGKKTSPFLSREGSTRLNFLSKVNLLRPQKSTATSALASSEQIMEKEQNQSPFLTSIIRDNSNLHSQYSPVDKNACFSQTDVQSFHHWMDKNHQLQGS